MKPPNTWKKCSKGIKYTKEGVVALLPPKESVVYADEGIIELADESIPQRAGIFYLPHKGVWKPAKAIPLRIVFDASQKSRSSPSLNDCIYEVLSFINSIYEIICSKAAFVQIRPAEEYKDLARFLWVRDTILSISRIFTRVPFGINASPSILNMNISKRMMKMRATDLPHLGVVAIDVAGSAHGADEQYDHKVVEMFTEAYKRGIHRTVHAGESGGPKEVFRVRFIVIVFLSGNFIVLFVINYNLLSRSCCSGLEKSPYNHQLNAAHSCFLPTDEKLILVDRILAAEPKF
uniref:A_deaminase domain-containing protein n=1 Tax=Heterorhabditis bacteriophora TaxID=37862 RepID=A0A1I7XS84_HETBA